MCEEEEEYVCYIYRKGRYIKYIPINMGNMVIRVRKDQKDYKYFNELFSVSNASIYVDYILPGFNRLEELLEMDSKSSYIGGTLNLQLNDSIDHVDYVVYEFYSNKLERKSTHKETTLKNISRVINLDSILD